MKLFIFSLSVHFVMRRVRLTRQSSAQTARFWHQRHLIDKSVSEENHTSVLLTQPPSPNFSSFPPYLPPPSLPPSLSPPSSLPLSPFPPSSVPPSLPLHPFIRPSLPLSPFTPSSVPPSLSLPSPLPPSPPSLPPSLSPSLPLPENSFKTEFYSISVLWNVYGDCENYGMMSGHTGAILELHFSRDGRCRVYFRGARVCPPPPPPENGLAPHRLCGLYMPP